MHPSRTPWAALPAALCLVVFLIPGCAGPGETPAERAERVHRDILTIDTHVDTPLRLGRPGFDLGRDNSDQRGSKVDFPRMRQGGLDAAFFAVYVSQGPRDEVGHQRALERALEIFDRIDQALAAHPDQAGLALTPDDAGRLAGEGRLAIYLGIENGYPVGRDLGLLERFYARGARYVTLCHSRHNDLCDSSTDPGEPEHGGLSELGRAVVAEMNRLGMIVDLSHVSDDTVRDVLAISRAPVMASHSCARALCDHPRNLSDDLIRAIADRGGVIQVCLVGSFLRELPPDPDRAAAVAELRARYRNFNELSPEEQLAAAAAWDDLDVRHPPILATVADVVDHIDHIVRVAGIAHVGIGTDFDGGGDVAGCRDVAGLPAITAELLRRGYSEADVARIWGGNFRRVFQAVVAEAGREAAETPGEAA